MCCACSLAMQLQRARERSTDRFSSIWPFTAGEAQRRFRACCDVVGISWPGWHAFRRGMASDCLTRAALYHIYFELGVGVQGPFWLIFHVRLSRGVKPSNLPLTTQTLTEMLEYDCAKSSQHSQFCNQALQLLSLHLHAMFLVFSVRSAWWFIFFWSCQSSSRPGCGLLFCTVQLLFLSAFGLACVSEMSETSGLGHLFALTEILPGKNVHSIASGADRVHVALSFRTHCIHDWLISCIHVS